MDVVALILSTNQDLTIVVKRSVGKRRKIISDSSTYSGRHIHPQRKVEKHKKEKWRKRKTPHGCILAPSAAHVQVEKLKCLCHQSSPNRQLTQMQMIERPSSCSPKPCQNDSKQNIGKTTTTPRPSHPSLGFFHTHPFIAILQPRNQPRLYASHNNHKRLHRVTQLKWQTYKETNVTRGKKGKTFLQ